MYAVSRVILVFALLGVFVGVSAQAFDTSYANFTIQALEDNSSNPLEGVQVTLRPDYMEMILLDTSFAQFTDTFGEALFTNIPMYVDTLTTIVDVMEAKKPFLLSTVGGDINITFPKFSEGGVSVYDLSGKCVAKESFRGNYAHVDLSRLTTGMYVYHAYTKTGEALKGKFYNNQVSVGSIGSEVPSSSLVQGMFKSATNISPADYWAVVKDVSVNPTHYSDSMLITLNEGENGLFPIYLEKIPRDTLWATGTLLTKHATAPVSLDSVNLVISSHNLATIDTLITAMSDSLGEYDFNLPLFTDLVTNLPSSSNGVYTVTLSKNGFDSDSISLPLSSGSNGNTVVYLFPTPPPQHVDIKTYVRDMNRDPIENILMVLKDTVTGSIDTLRSDTAGIIFFENMPVNKTYFVALGGKEGYKSWDGTGFPIPNTFILETPNSISSFADTIMEKNYIMISDTLHSYLNNLDISISSYDMRGMFADFNLQLSLDTARAHFKPAYWTPTQIATREAFQQQLSQDIDIPILSQSTPFVLDSLANFNPLAPNWEVIGTNFVGGGNQTFQHYYGFTDSNSPFYGDVTILACDSVKVSGDPDPFIKEHFRWFGAEDVSSRSSIMNPTAAPLNDIDAALIHMYFLLGQNRFKYQVHDLPNLNHLRDEITLIQAPVLN